MLYCLQNYLLNGLLEHDFYNLEIRKFIKETSFDFYEWSNEKDNIELDKRIYKSALYNSFTDEYSDYKKWLSNKRFWQWIDIFIKQKKYTIEHGKDLGGRWVIIKKEDIEFDAF